MKRRPCGMLRESQELSPIVCRGKCWPCAFNPAERDRRLREGHFIGGKLFFHPATGNKEQEEHINEQA